MKMKSIVVIVTVLCSANSFAVMPVIDAGAIANLGKQLTELRKQYKLLNDTYTNAKDQLDNAKSQLNTVNELRNFNQGNYGFGDLKNKLGDLADRQYSPDSWDDALNNISGGNPTRYKQLAASYDNNHRSLSDDEFLKGANPQQLEAYKQNRAVNKAASIESTYAYDEVNKHIKAVYELSGKIEKAENTKSAIDLNSRLIAEVAYLQAQNIKLQTIISQQMAQNGATQIDDVARQAQFNRLPDGFK